MKTTLLSCLALSVLCSALAAQSPSNPGESDHPQLKVISSSNPVMPSRLKDVGIIDGECRIVISVDPTGKISDHLLLAYTNIDLADTCVKALNSWRFAPPTYHGESVSIQREVTFDFDSHGAVITMDLNSYVGSMTNRILGGTRLEFRPHTLKELDRIPTPLHTEHPVAPKGMVGEAVVEFYIDTQGAVRMPSLVQADVPELGYAAAATVRQWSFEPPTCQGKPVLVRAQQTFRFQK